MDLAKRLNYPELVIILQAADTAITSTAIPPHIKDSFQIFLDASVSRLSEWLRALGGEEYFSSFARAGYDLEFIAKEGLQDQDLDCVGIPHSKLGLRRKLLSRHKIGEFVETSGEEDSESEREGDSDNESND